MAASCPMRRRKSSPPISRGSRSISRCGASPIPTSLKFLDSPPRAALEEARALLTSLGALDGDGRITEEGRAIARLALPPRLARMVVDAAREGRAGVAAEIAVGADRARPRRRRRRSDPSARSFPPRPLAARRGRAAAGAEPRRARALTPALSRTGRSANARRPTGMRERGASLSRWREGGAKRRMRAFPPPPSPTSANGSPPRSPTASPPRAASAASS